MFGVGCNDQIATMKGVKLSLFAFLLVTAATCISFCEGKSQVLCIESERKALLKFKHDLIDESNRLSSWVEGENCCEWIGVSCNNLTGHVNKLQLALLSNFPITVAEGQAYGRSQLKGKISPSLLDLKYLNFLDLSNNNFGGVQIPEFFGSLKRLTYLNLTGANFLGEIPHKLGNLSKLQYLDLGRDNDLEAKTLQWVSGLSSLRYLNLRESNLSSAIDWAQVTNKLPSLVELHLSDCNLNNDPSPIIVNNTSLAVLDLSANKLNSVPTWVFSLGSLVSIDLSFSEVKGEIPKGFQNMSSLKYLDLTWNPLSSSSIHSWLSNLSQLQFLGLQNVGLLGKISSVIGNMTSLTHLDLSYNEFDQGVSEIIEGLSKCSLDGLKSTGKLSPLKFLDVSNNRLNGTLPQSLGQLGNLEYLDVTNNMLEGNISKMHFSNLTRLRILKASNNKLTFNPNPGWIPPFNCESIELRDWQLGPEFPQWLQFQKNLSSLDISNAGISGVIPDWFWNLSTELSYWNFSHNQLIGKISYLPLSGFVDLSSNKFTGPLPQLLPRVSHDAQYLFLSNNLFSGPLFNFLCNSSDQLGLMILDIESNFLSGVIPDCLKTLEWLNVLNLGNNHLSGKIPRSIGFMRGVTSLNLRNNSLFGEVPSTLQQLARVMILDLSENQFSGSIPTWIGDKLSKLVVLNLRSNNFQGYIPEQICTLSSLQVLDLGNNNISGAIPKCFGNLSAMATVVSNFMSLGSWAIEQNDFTMSAVLEMKGRKDEYSITLGLVASIDLSANCLIGEISEDLGSLLKVRSLNLSRNLLTGKLPEKIGDMKSLESLDLSMNRLYGEIPSSFSSLNFLSLLNLSYNNLSGQIPSSTQLQSFDEFSYIGNHLCGPPISKNCRPNGRADNVPNRGSHEGRKRSKVNGLYVSIVVGFVMGFWGVVTPLFFIRSWRIAYYRKLEHIGDKLYVFWASLGK